MNKYSIKKIRYHRNVYGCDVTIHIVNAYLKILKNALLSRNADMPGEFEQMQAHVTRILKQLYADTDAVWLDSASIKEIFGFRPGFK